MLTNSNDTSNDQFELVLRIKITKGRKKLVEQEGSLRFNRKRRKEASTRSFNNFCKSVVSTL